MNEKKRKFLTILVTGVLCTVFGASLSLCVMLPMIPANPAETTQVSPLNLDPENDEIIAYTNGGLAIRSHGVTGSNTPSLQYITLGTYEGTPVNWLLVAASDKGFAENITPAGQAINTETSNDIFCGQVDSNLEHGQMLVITEKAFSTTLSVSDFTFKGTTIGPTPNAYLISDSNTQVVSFARTTCDSVDDYFSTYLGATQINESCNAIVNSLNLGSKVVVNSNFSSANGFSFSSSQMSTYVPLQYHTVSGIDSPLSIDYLVSDSISYSANTSGVSRRDVDGSGLYGPCKRYPTGSATLNYCHILFPSNITEIIGVAKANVTNSSGYQHSGGSGGTKDYYFYAASTSYSWQTEPSDTAYFRPATILDISQL